MKDLRFYAEYTDSTRTAQTGNVVAVQWKLKQWDRFAGCFVYDGYAAVLAYPNCEVASTGAAESYLHTYCRRVSEQQARAMHPRLFSFLEGVTCTQNGRNTP